MEGGFNPFALTGKTILITGAASGIGQATAVTCSRLGAKVIVCTRSEARSRETMGMLVGGGHVVLAGDLTNAGDVEKIVEMAPTLDGIVLCAGKGLTLPFVFCSPEKQSDLFDINFRSPVELLRLLTKKKKLNKGCSVVFVSSVGGNTVFSVGGSIYGASKAALTATMKYCAKELAVKGVRVNSVNPGMTKTKLINRGTLTEEQFKTDQERYPLKRYGEPEDIANGIVYLLSDASSWVTGHALVIDGGISI